MKEIKYPEVSFKRIFQMIQLELLLVLFPCWIGMVEMKVTCTVPSTHIIIGEILTLFCNTSEISCSSCSEQWKKGELLLSFGDASVDTDKYTVEQQKDGFTLEIKNTTFDDFNVEYKCSYGFSSCTASPTLPASFEYHPRRDTTEKYLSVTDRTLLLDVVFQAIHPVPVCSIHLDEENLSSGAKKETVRTGYLYQVNMTLCHTVKPDQCQGRLLVSCTTGTKRDTIVDYTVSFECSVFIDPSRRDTTEKNVAVIHRTLRLDVVFKKIHPVPVCSIYLDKENLSSSVKIWTVKTGNLYQVNMTLSHTVKPDQCKGRLLVDCSTGTKKDTIVDRTYPFNCSGGRDYAKEMLIIIICSASACVVVCIITCICVIKSENLWMKLCTNCCSKLKGSLNKKDSNDSESGQKMIEIIQSS